MRWNVRYWQSAALAGFAGLADVLGEQRIRVLNDAWWHAGGIVIIVLIQLYKWVRPLYRGNGSCLAQRLGSLVHRGVHTAVHHLERLGNGLPPSRGRYVRASNKAALDGNTAKSRLIKLRKGMDY